MARPGVVADPRPKARPTVSVAVCTYQGAAHLQRQLDSIEAQTVAPDEVVLSDDGSTDGTLDLLRAFERGSRSRVRVLRREAPVGVALNFEHALRSCSAGLVLLADQDDVWVPHKVERFVEAFARHPEALLVFSDAELVDAGERPLGRTMWEAVGLDHGLRRELAVPLRATRILLRTALVTGAATGIRRELLDCALPVPADAGFLHDAWLALVASCHGPLVALDERLLAYRQHEAQHTGAPEAGQPAPPLVLDRERQHRELLRQRAEAALLLDRLRQCPHGSGRPAVAFLREHVAHTDLRLAPDRSARAVVAALARGRYHRHSGGLRSAAKDLWRR